MPRWNNSNCGFQTGHKSLHTEEGDKKHSLALLGKSLSEETKQKISLALKGYPHSKEWNRKVSLSLKGKQICLGRKLSEETKKKIGIANSIALKGKHFPNMFKKGYHPTEEIREKIKQARAKQITPVKDTSIEVKIQEFLKVMGIDFFTHQYLKQIEHSYQCDILIPSMNLVIECDGNYWHKYPIGRELDKIRTNELINKGFKVLRLWEQEIRIMDINEFKETLRQVVV
jgi:very-short-patch-repair endonuclease